MRGKEQEWAHRFGVAVHTPECGQAKATIETGGLGEWSGPLPDASPLGRWRALFSKVETRVSLVL